MTIITTETPGATGVPTLLDGVRTGWIARFRDWVAPITEGPEAIFAVGSVEVGLVIGSVAIQYGRRLYPYFFPRGGNRRPQKSTVVSRGHDIRALITEPPELVRVSCITWGVGPRVQT